MPTLDPAHLVGVGGALGAVLRLAVSARLDTEQLPAGTITVNVLGSFVLGLVTFLGVDHRLLLFVGTGACGSFTTFSSFSVDTVQLWQGERRGRAILNAAGTFLGAVGAIALAWGLVQLVG